ncbi:hypothetical protein SK128_020067 [Halocaridina rubra]|uniref:Apple domain-containing protein n=1 Tax=Halocaridina rubra TaxID=373956 RepID=A0AAN8WQA4_HALRR
MRITLKWWLTVMVCSHLYDNLLCQANPFRTYKLLYNGGQKVIASYTLYQTFSSISCATICNGKSGCWMYTWNSASNECQVLNFLTGVITTGVAPSTMRTYYVNGFGGKKIVKTPIASPWTQIRDTCANMGGRLHLPVDNTFCYLLNHVFGAIELHIGLWRYPSDTTVWYNMDGLTTFPRLNWGPGYPNNAGGMQYYGTCYQGGADDESNSVSRYGVCEI